MRRQLASGAEFLLERDGVMAVGGYDLVGYVKSNADSDRPDTQIMFTPISTTGTSSPPGDVKVDKRPGAMFLGYPLRPTAASTLHQLLHLGRQLCHC